MRFTAKTRSHSIQMDSTPPIGNDTAMTPKELVLNGVCGCTAMDVVALFKKHKQAVDSFEIEADAKTAEKYPTMFTNIELTYRAKGSIDKDKYIEAVTLSQTKYCAVSAMISKAAPIHYKIFLNDEQIGSGQAHFG